MLKVNCFLVLKRFGSKTLIVSSSRFLRTATQIQPKFEENEEKVEEPESFAKNFEQPPAIFYRPSGSLYSLTDKKNVKQVVNRLETTNRNLKSQKLRVIGTIDRERLLELEAKFNRKRRKNSELLGLYAKLAKARLSGLVVITAMAGYALAPGPLNFPVLLACGLGTALLSSSANALNQLLEIEFDSQMLRTKSRPLVTRNLSKNQALIAASIWATAGTSLLYFCTNPLTAALGAANLVLYAGVYTPMKRHSVACTWVGSIVGAIPPLMGWAACSDLVGFKDCGVLILPAILYAWQFPHFNALSWNLRREYGKAGYQIMSDVRPDLCRRTTLRYSLMLCGVCSLAAPLSGLTTWAFAIDSIPLNAALVYFSFRFYKQPDSKTSRKLFRFSLVYLPALIILMMIGKRNFVMFDKSTEKNTVENSSSPSSLSDTL